MPRTILLVDDSITIRRVAELTFADTDVRVETAGTGREALEKLASFKPDVVVADAELPDVSGYDLCARVKSSSHPVPVLLLAGAFEPFDDDRGRRSGADGHIVKPFDPGELVRRVDELLALSSADTTASRGHGGAEELEAILDELAAEPSLAGAPPESGVPWEPGVAGSDSGTSDIDSTSLLDSVAPADEASAASFGLESLAPGTRDAGRSAHVTLEAGTIPGEPASATGPMPALDEPLGTVGPSVREEEPSPAEELQAASDTGSAGPRSEFAAAGLSPAEIDALARAVVARLGDQVLREIAWDVVPDLAEVIIRERIRELEREEQSGR